MRRSSFVALLGVSLWFGSPLSSEAAIIKITDAGNVIGGANNNPTNTTHDFGLFITGAANPSTTQYGISNINPPGTAQTRSYTISTTGDATVSPSGAGSLTSGSSLGLTTGINIASGIGLHSGTVEVAGTSGDNTDTISLSATVLDHSNASFSSSSDVNSLTIDFGTLAQFSPTANQTFNLFNLITTAGFTAGLDLDSIIGTGDTGILFTNLGSFSNLSAGTGTPNYIASFTTSNLGVFSADYTLNFSDQNLAGATTQTMLLHLQGNVIAAVPEPGSLTLVGTGLLALAGLRRFRRQNSNVSDPTPQV